MRGLLVKIGLALGFLFSVFKWGKSAQKVEEQKKRVKAHKKQSKKNADASVRTRSDAVKQLRKRSKRKRKS